MIIKNPTIIIKKAKLQAKIATPTTSSQTIVADSNYDGLSSVEISAVDNTIDSNITAENIKKDVTILGVTGTLESQTSTPNLQTKFIMPTKEGQTVVPDSGYDGLQEVVVYGDQSLSPENIRYGYTIFDVIGEYTGEYTGECTDVHTQIISKTIQEINPDILVGISEIGDYVFYNCPNLVNAFLEGSNITSIGRYAFSDCESLYNVYFPITLTYVGNNAFRDSPNVHVDFPIDPETGEYVCNIEIIDNSAFYKMTRLHEVPPLRNIISIAGNAFYQCNNLNNIILGENLQKIEARAFYGCTALTTMTILATTPPTLANTSAISTATTTIYIPAGTLSAYQTATNWSSFADKFVELSE